MAKHSDSDTQNGRDRPVLTLEIIEAMREPFLKAYDAWYKEISDLFSTEPYVPVGSIGDHLFHMFSESVQSTLHPQAH